MTSQWEDLAARVEAAAKESLDRRYGPGGRALYARELRLIIEESRRQLGLGAKSRRERAASLLAEIREEMVAANAGSGPAWLDWQDGGEQRALEAVELALEEERNMASGWMHEEARRVTAEAREVLTHHPEHPIYLHFQRGRLAVSIGLSLASYALVTRLQLPMGQTDAEIAEWVIYQCRSVPCHPER